MAILAGDVLRCTIQYNLAGTAAHQNVWYYEAGAGVNDTEANVMSALTTQFDVAYALLEPELATDVTDDEVVFAKRNPVDGKWNKIGTGNTTKPNGTGAAGQLPNGVAAVIRWLTDGVGEQGRKFIGGLDNGAIVDNIVQAAAITVLTNFGNSMDNAIGVSGGLMVPGWWSEASTVFRPFNTTEIINTIAGYQRRRKPGIGI